MWYSIQEKIPEPGAHILAWLGGCKICDCLTMTVREGEGLGHIIEWKYDDTKGEKNEEKA